MVLRHMSSKDIARALSISPHTVDQRIRHAMKTLGVANRVEAARLVEACEAEGEYQSLIYQPPDIDSAAAAQPIAAPVPERPRPSDKEVRNAGTTRTIAWIAIAVAAAALAFAGLFVGLNALSQFTR